MTTLYEGNPMSDNPLLERLVWDLKPVSRQSGLMDTLIPMAICGVELLLYLVACGAWSDVPMAVTLPSFWWKLGILGAITLMGVAMADGSHCRLPGGMVVHQYSA
jgi:hypothetical protein